MCRKTDLNMTELRLKPWRSQFLLHQTGSLHSTFAHLSWACSQGVATIFEESIHGLPLYQTSSQKGGSSDTNDTSDNPTLGFRRLTWECVRPGKHEFEPGCESSLMPLQNALSDKIPIQSSHHFLKAVEKSLKSEGINRPVPDLNFSTLLRTPNFYICYQIFPLNWILSHLSKEWLGMREEFH